MPLHVAYLVNQYPKVSHSFIRREIQALERLGLVIERYAMRGWGEPLIDPADVQERTRTRYLLQDGLAPLLGSLLSSSLHAPVKFLGALRLALMLGWRADRPLVLHIAYLAEACLLMRWMRSAGVTHLHAHFGTNSASVALLARALGGPSYSFTVHGPEEFDKPESLKLREKVSACAFVVAISSYGRSQIYRWIGSSQWNKVHTVHCGLDESYAAVESDTAPDVSRLVCVGRLCAQKGQLLLLRAIRRLVDAGTQVQVVLAGDGEMRAEVEAMIDQLALQSHVRITGWIGGSQVRDEILAARALVLPSFAEGLPVVLMEAMALRRPVLTTYIAGIPELVINGESGWLVPAGDEVALADALARCLAAPTSTLERMGAKGRERVLQRHSIDVEARKLAALITTAASAEGRTA